MKKIFCQFILEDEAVESIHQGDDDRHGKEIDQIISSRTFCVTKAELNEHLAVHLPSMTGRRGYPVRRAFCSFLPAPIHEKFYRPSKKGCDCSNWLKKHRA